jgi:hypothetical protein
MTPEGKIKTLVKEFLSNYGDIWRFAPMSFGYGRRGIPDIIGCYEGKFFSIETKAGSEKMKPWQERENAAIVDAGGKVFRFGQNYGIEDFKLEFKEWVE